MPKLPTDGPKPYHFFTSSVMNWQTGDDLPKLIRQQTRVDRPKSGMKATGFNVFVVPLPSDAHYDIDEYKPQVEGTRWLFGYNYNTKQTSVPEMWELK